MTIMERLYVWAMFYGVRGTICAANVGGGVAAWLVGWYAVAVIAWLAAAANLRGMVFPIRKACETHAAMHKVYGTKCEVDL